jgi:predicted nucleotidyltransferase
VRPRGIGEMRLSECERRGLVHAFADVSDPAYLIGSRLDDDRRGGDIDVLVMATGLSAEQRLRLSLRIAVRFRSVCDEKIDVHVFDPHALTDEERAFLTVVTMRPLAL